MGNSVAVLFGGPSNEHEISCLSAKTVISALAEAGHQVLAIAVDRDLTMRLILEPLVQFAAVADQLPTTADLVGERVSTIAADIAFPVLHGSWGEDGGVQQQLNQFGLPYVGSGVVSSKLAMDKSATKERLVSQGIKVLPAITVNQTNWQDHLADIHALGKNLFVKPCHGGSSVGVTHVKSTSELDAALVKVFAMSDQALIESALDHPREIEIGVLQAPNGSLKVSLCGEIKLKPEFDFYDYSAKYLADGAELVVPAEISTEQYEEVALVAMQAFASLGCAGLARVDFLMSQDGVVYLNEVNTMPGFTQISMYPKMFAASGVALTELVDQLVQHGLTVDRTKEN